MSAIYRWLLAVGGAVAVTLVLFAAMPHALRMNNSEAGEEVASHLPSITPRAPQDMYARTIITHPFEFSPSMQIRHALAQTEAGLTAANHSSHGDIMWDDFEWPPTGDERRRRNAENFNEVTPGAAIPASDDVSISMTGLLPIGQLSWRGYACQINPAYPAEALAQGLEGHVELEFDILATGETANIDVIESSHPVFSDAAIRQIECWRYASDGPRENVRTRVAYELWE